jgi:hypothetical protein
MLEAADHIEALAAEVERLRAFATSESNSANKLLSKGLDLCDLTEELERKVERAEARAESAERALAEAVEIMRPLCKAALPFTLNGDCSLVKASTVKAARDFITAQEKEKGK